MSSDQGPQAGTDEAGSSDEEEDYETVEDIDEEFIPITAKARKLYAVQNILDTMVGASVGVICACPMTAICTSWNFTEHRLEQRQIDRDEYLRQNHWGGMNQILRSESFRGIPRFFTGLPFVLGARLFEVILSQAPILSAFALYDYQPGSQPMREMCARVAASLLITPVKVAAEVAFARAVGAQACDTPHVELEPFEATLRSVQPLVLSWRVLHNIYLQWKGVKEIDEDDWVCDLADTGCRLMPVQLPLHERRTFRESLSTIAAQSTYSKLMTLSTHLPFIIMDAPSLSSFFGSEKYPNFQQWLLGAAVGSVSLLARPGWSGEDWSLKETATLFGSIVGWSILPVVSISMGSNYLINAAYQSLRARLGLETFDTPTKCLSRKLRAVELQPGGLVRGRLDMDSMKSMQEKKSMNKSSSSGGGDVGDFDDDFDELPPSPMPISRQLTVDVKQAAVPALAGKRLALLLRLRCHYVPDAPRIDELPSLEVSLGVCGTSAESIMFHEPSICAPEQACLFAIRNEPAPSLAQIALLPRHALVAQDYPTDAEGTMVDWRDPHLAKYLLKINFTNETAQDVGGSFREFMDLMGTYITESCTFHLEEEDGSTDNKNDVAAARSAIPEDGPSVPVPAAPVARKPSTLAQPQSVSAAGHTKDWEVGDEVEVLISMVYIKGVVTGKKVPRLYGDTTVTVKCLFNQDQEEALSSETNMPYEMELKDVRKRLAEPRKLFAAGPDGGLLPLRIHDHDQAGGKEDGDGEGLSSSLEKEDVARLADDRQALFSIGRLMALGECVLLNPPPLLHSQSPHQAPTLFSLTSLLRTPPPSALVCLFLSLSLFFVFTAVIRNTPLGVPFCRCVYKVLVGESFSAEDVQRIDPQFYKFRVQPLLEDGGVEAMEAITCDKLYFVGVANPSDVAARGSDPDGDELVPGGKTKRVTEKNKKKYVRLLTEHFLVGHCRLELGYLAQGFYDVIPKSVLRLSDANNKNSSTSSSSSSSSSDDSSASRLAAVDLELLVCGIPTLDLHEWRQHTEGMISDKHLEEAKAFVKTLDKDNEDEMEKLAEMSLYIKTVETNLEWFWDNVAEMDTSKRAKLLAFACGTGRLPADGFRALKPNFKVDLAGTEPPTNLPSSHTCFNQLCLPPYRSKEEMQQKLDQAIGYGAEGFGFV
jgi:hypothetical protein